jgi:hypothetical protein
LVAKFFVTSGNKEDVCLVLVINQLKFQLVFQST